MKITLYKSIFYLIDVNNIWFKKKLTSHFLGFTYFVILLSLFLYVHNFTANTYKPYDGDLFLY